MNFKWTSTKTFQHVFLALSHTLSSLLMAAKSRKSLDKTHTYLPAYHTIYRPTRTSQVNMIKRLTRKPIGLILYHLRGWLLETIFGIHIIFTTWSRDLYKNQLDWFHIGKPIGLIPVVCLHKYGSARNLASKVMYGVSTTEMTEMVNVQWLRSLHSQSAIVCSATCYSEMGILFWVATTKIGHCSHFGQVNWMNKLRIEQP